MYYPKSQITTNLYSNGELVYKDTNQQYIGYYFKTSTNQYFTGKTPQDAPNVELIIGKENSNSSNTINSERLETVDNVTYSKLSNNTKDFKSQIPEYYATLPTEQDYQIGESRRYFCKKSNELIYIEISKETYDKIINKDDSVLWIMYVPFDIPWQIKGNKESVYNTNKNIVSLISFRLKLTMFDQYLKEDYLKYYKQ